MHFQRGEDIVIRVFHARTHLDHREIFAFFGSFENHFVVDLEEKFPSQFLDNNKSKNNNNNNNSNNNNSNSNKG